MAEESSWRKQLDNIKIQLSDRRKRDSAISAVGGLIRSDECDTSEKRLDALMMLTERFSYDLMPMASIVSQIDTSLTYIIANRDHYIYPKYLQSVEYEIASIANSKAAKKPAYLDFAKSFYELAQSKFEQYTGTYLKISDPIIYHGKSVMITPEKPEHAAVCLFKGNTRSLFARSGKQESAEYFIHKMYGSDGEYYKHYASFLNCSARYPGEKFRFISP